MSRGGEGWCSLRGSLEAGFAAQLRLSIGLPVEMGQRFTVGGAPSSARKVLRLAQTYDDLPGQFP